MSVAARVDGDHFELPADAVELLPHVRPADRQGSIEEITQALAAAAKTKDFRPLQDVLEAWTVTVRLQRQPGYEAMIERMQRRKRGQPVDLDELRRPRG
jgi:sulfite reductase beta subunit-like hemoprotein